MRTEIIGDATLHLGDCREILPTISPVDAVITDPVWPNAPDGMFEGVEPYALFAETVALLPPARQLVVCLRSDCDPRFLRGVPTYWQFQQCIWQQYIVPGYAGRVMHHEIAYVFGAPIKFAKGQQVIPCMSPKAQPWDRPMQQGDDGHPCPRTTMHQDFLMRWFSEPGGLVLDPFMGSGTAGIAAHNFSRPFIGIEINPTYFDLACKRIEKAQRQARLFAEPQPVQEEIEL